MKKIKKTPPRVNLVSDYDYCTMPEGSPIDKKQISQVKGFLRTFGKQIPPYAMAMIEGFEKAKRYFLIPVRLDDTEEYVIISGIVLPEKVDVRGVYDPIDFLYVVKVGEKLKKYLQQLSSETGVDTSEA